MKLSERLLKIASFVTEGNTLADIGTDHGYIPVYLTAAGKVPHALAMDLRSGPLKRAEAHIKEAGMEEKVETRLSDGMAALKSGEADTILIAGMGGDLMVRILKDGESLRASVKEYVLSPHTEWGSVRRYLRENGYLLTEEAMLEEDGKFYTVLKAVSRSGADDSLPDPYEAVLSLGISEEAADLFGPALISSDDPVLLKYLKKEKIKYNRILDELNEQAETPEELNEHSAERIEELSHYLDMIAEAEQ
jgi:tRNA (adenine22-N1)-methyltransferase